MEGPPQNGTRSNEEQQGTVPVISSDTNVYQTVESQQPIQFQNIAGPGQISFNGNLQPFYYGENPYPHQMYIQDPIKVAYGTPYPVPSTPQLYGGNYYSTPQQPGMMVQQQPTSVPIGTAIRTSSGDNYMTLSVLMTFLALIIGGWPSLLCTISALFISYNAKDDEKRGNIAAARTKANISLGLNVAAIVFVVVMWTVVAIPVAVTVSAQTSAAQLLFISPVRPTTSTVRPTTSTVRPTTSTVRPTTSTVRPTTTPTTTPTPYCYTTPSSVTYCYTSYCYYSSSSFFPCNYYAYYSYSSYSYSTSYSSSYYSQSCSSTYSLSCLYG